MTAPRTYILPKLTPRAGAIERLARVFKALPLDQAWRIEVREYKPSRSAAQNAYLHGVCYKTIADAIGYDMEEVAEFLCGTHFGWKDKRRPKTPRCPEGVGSVPIRTTTRNEAGERDVLSTTAMMDYVAFVQRFAAGKGIFIPDPDPGYWKGEA